MAGRQIRRGTAAERNALGGLAAGELGFETDTEDVYIGAAAGDELISDKSARDFLNGQDQAVKTTSNVIFAKVSLPTYAIGSGQGIFEGADVLIRRVKVAGASNDNYFIGRNTGGAGLVWSANIEASYNYGWGIGALNAITKGWANIGIGTSCLQDCTTGAHNTAVGDECMHLLTTGSYNVAIGMLAMLGNVAAITGSNNVAVGPFCLNKIVSGGNNVAIGNTALGAAALTGNHNVGIGNNALGAAVAATYCVAIGYHAHQANIDGNECVAIGRDALMSSTSGGYLTAVGGGAFGAINGVHRGVALGWLAGRWETVGDKLFIDCMNRTDEAGGRARSLIYGIFDAATANQRLRINGRLGVTECPNYANNAAAVAGGLTSGELYTETGTDPLRVCSVV